MVRKAKKLSDGRKRTWNKPRPHVAVLSEHHLLMQLTADTFADISDLPITLLRRVELTALYQSLRSSHHFFADRFPNIWSFQQFISLSNADPLRLLVELNENPSRWRDVLNDLQSKLYLTRPSRAEPIVRLLRDHWTWRWVEALAHLDTALKELVADSKIAFYESFSKDVWLCDITPAGRDELLLIGPVKDKKLSAQLAAEAMSSFVHKYYQTLTSPGFSELHPVARYEQFFYDRPSIYAADLRARLDTLALALELVKTVVWPRGHEVDHFDITACTELAYCISDFINNPLIDALGDIVHQFSISYFYPLYLQSLKKRVRRLTCSISPRRISHLDFDAPALEAASGLTFRSEAFVSDGSEASGPLLSKYVNQLFEEGARRRRTVQSQRMLEELLLLRYKLADSFGVLTAAETSRRKTGEQLEVTLGKRIARVAAEMCHAEVAVIYRYDHLTGKLHSVGAHLDNPSGLTLGREDYNWMEEAGLRKDSREKSVSYTAADLNRCVAYNDSNDFAPLVHTIETMLQPPRSSEVPAGKALVALPIRVFGRLWGVFEVVSKQSNAFSHPQMEWLEKVADLIGPYYHEQFMINSLYHIAAPHQLKSEGPEQFDELAQHVAGMFLCDTACLWLRDLFNSNLFRCVGFTGRGDLQELRQLQLPLPMFETSNRHSVAGSAIVNKSIWVFGRLGDSPFDGPWLDKEHTRSLLALKYKHIAVLPIYDVEGNATAVVSIYSKDRPFLENWENWARYIGNYMGAVISRVHNAREVEIQDRRLVAHEIVNAASTIKASTSNLFDAIRRLPHRSRQYRLWISDIQKHTNDIDEIVSGWASADVTKLSRRSNAHLLARARERFQTISTPELNFRHEFQACVSPLHRTLRKNRLRYTIWYLKSGLFLRMHPEDLRKILNNLLQNAIKYTPPYNVIECSFEQKKHSVSFSISNVGPRLESGEVWRAFDLGFRGENARKKRGTGVGLYVVHRLCDLYGISATYEDSAEEPLEGNSELSKHVITLDFPAKIVVDYGE